MTCNHTVGILEDKLIGELGLPKTLEVVSKDWNEYRSVSAFIYAKNLTTKLSPKDFLDGRKGHMTMFKHCPYCGEKINWKKIKKEVSDL